MLSWKSDNARVTWAGLSKLFQIHLTALLIVIAFETNGPTKASRHTPECICPAALYRSLQVTAADLCISCGQRTISSISRRPVEVL
jgi:hypothetical protein